VSDGTRTRDFLDHNQVLYQLSYTHHGGPAELSTDRRRVKCTGRLPSPKNRFRPRNQASSLGRGSGTAPVRVP
jgi:hypothetical protein